MSMNLNASSMKIGGHKLLRGVNKYKVFIFFIVVALLYGFIIWRINYFASAEPTDAEKTAASEHARVPKINEGIVTKMKNLKDNSVNVQTLFESARSSPFSE